SEHRLQLVLVAGLVAACGGEVVPGAGCFAHGDAGTGGVMDDVVLDHRALGPVRADEAGLVRGRRCPRGGGVRQLETAHGDVVQVLLGGVEHRLPGGDLHELGPRVRTEEVRPDGGGLLAHLGVPHRPGPVRVRYRLLRLGPTVDGGGPGGRTAHRGPVGRLVQAASVEVHLAEVPPLAAGGRDEPVPRHGGRERVHPGEQGAGHLGAPDVAVLAVPGVDRFGALDHHLLTRGGLVDDAALVAEPAADRADPLPVLPRTDPHRVAGYGQLRRTRDGAQRGVLGRIGAVGTGRGDREDGDRNEPFVWRSGRDYLVNPAVSPDSSGRRPTTYSTRIGSVVRITEASTAGMFTLYCPWKLHSASGSTRLSGLWVSTSGSRNAFHTTSAW